jgi:NAD(P)-dependent dehydrogenase (short-subunit alcohol dehydrogenase family)
MEFRIDVRDKVAIVAGGAQGMGRTFVDAFLSSGVHVAVADIAVPPESKETRKNILGIPTDITDPDSVRKMVQETLNVKGGRSD